MTSIASGNVGTEKYIKKRLHFYADCISIDKKNKCPHRTDGDECMAYIKAPAQKYKQNVSKEISEQ